MPFRVLPWLSLVFVIDMVSTKFALGTILAAVAALAAGPAAGQWKPGKVVELVVGSGAGGAADRQARVVQKYLQAFPGIPGVIINNRPGGGGNVAYAYLDPRIRLA